MDADPKYLERLSLIMAGPHPFKPTNIPIKTQWDIDQHWAWKRAREEEEKKAEEEKKVRKRARVKDSQVQLMPPLEGVPEESRNKIPWFFRLNPSVRKQIQTAVYVHAFQPQKAVQFVAHNFKLTIGQSREIFHHFTVTAQTVERVPIDLSTSSPTLPQVKRFKQSPSVEGYSPINIDASEHLRLEGNSRYALTNLRASSKVPITQLSDVSRRLILPGQLIVITGDRQRFYAGVRRIRNLQLDFTDNQLVYILGKCAKVRGVSNEHRTVTVELMVRGQSYEVVLPIDAVDHNFCTKNIISGYG